MRFRRILCPIVGYFVNKWFLLVLYTKSLFFNYHLSSGYLADTLMEPMFWFVDNFTEILGPVSEPMNSDINIVLLSNFNRYL